MLYINIGRIAHNLPIWINCKPTDIRTYSCAGSISSRIWSPTLPPSSCSSGHCVVTAADNMEIFSWKEILIRDFLDPDPQWDPNSRPFKYCYFVFSLSLCSYDLVTYPVIRSSNKQIELSFSLNFVKLRPTLYHTHIEKNPNSNVLKCTILCRLYRSGYCNVLIIVCFIDGSIDKLVCETNIKCRISLRTIYEYS